MANLLEDTREAMEDAGLSPDDIVFIGSPRSGHACTWEEFQSLADREYDDGYGTAEVAGDLEIHFRDGSFMDRGEYDGSEWWEVNRPFVAPSATLPISRLFITDRGYESTLAAIDQTLRENGEVSR